MLGKAASVCTSSFPESLELSDVDSSSSGGGGGGGGLVEIACRCAFITALCQYHGAGMLHGCIGVVGGDLGSVVVLRVRRLLGSWRIF